MKILCLCANAHIPSRYKSSSHHICVKGQCYLTHTVYVQMQERQKAPQAVDFSVPPGVSVVTLTGPNTGGKTASLKALGLTAAMAKAGLFLPLQAPKGTIPCHSHPLAHTSASGWTKDATSQQV